MSLEVGLVVGSRLRRLRHRRGSLVLSERPGSKPWPFIAKDECPVPLTVRGTQALVSFAPLAFKLFYAARQNAVLRRSPFPSP